MTEQMSLEPYPKPKYKLDERNLIFRWFKKASQTIILYYKIDFSRILLRLPSSHDVFISASAFILFLISIHGFLQLWKKYHQTKYDCFYFPTDLLSVCVSSQAENVEILYFSNSHFVISKFIE